MSMLSVWDFIKETQFCKNFEEEIKFSSSKIEVSGYVKFDSSRC